MSAWNYSARCHPQLCFLVLYPFLPIYWKTSSLLWKRAPQNSRYRRLGCAVKLAFSLGFSWQGNTHWYPHIELSILGAQIEIRWISSWRAFVVNIVTRKMTLNIRTYEWPSFDVHCPTSVFTVADLQQWQHWRDLSDNGFPNPARALSKVNYK